jgi:GNAT superfamily N-acetyltransferase
VFALPAGLIARGLSLRPEAEADIPFLERLFISTRWEEVAPIIDWTDEQKRFFLEGQFRAQRHHYLTYYPDCERDVLESEGKPCGRLYLDRRAGTLAIVDISLLPEWRGRGVGTEMLKGIFAEASAADKSVAIQVEKFNPALRLYQRLGFVPDEDLGVYLSMVWRAKTGGRAG